MRLWTVSLLVLVVGCGARSGLSDLGPGADSGVDRPDSGPIFPDGARPDAAACGAPCSDGLFCNGLEFCEETVGRCRPGIPPDCGDGSECTVDSCDLMADACRNVRVDRDFDRDGITGCEGDCNDSDSSIFPGAPEVCQGVDDDCDGSIDEGALNECRDCRPDCIIVDMPREVDWVIDDGNSSGVELDSMGRIVLSEMRTEFPFAWISNSEIGTVTKLDTRDGTQAAEYHSVLQGPGNGARPPDEVCLTDVAGGNCPSRTAVDLTGAVYIANRGFFAQGTVTKIAGLPEDCIDRNGNGTIETSGDRDGDGIIERSVTGEFLGQADECILWTVDVGASGSVPRAVAVAADGTVWIGLFGEQRVLQLEPSDGSVLRSVDLTLGFMSFRPYGAAIASDGTLWMTEPLNGRIMSVNTATGTRGVIRIARDATGCSGSYGIAVDSRDRVWIAGFQCEVAFRFDPATGSWFTVELPDSGVGRGIAADDRGFIYMAASHEWVTVGGPGGFDIGPETTRVTRFRADDGGGVTIFGTAAAPLPGLGSTGVGLDPDRNLWLINQSSGTATRLNPTTGASAEYAVGAGPYTYSDFTGFALRTFTAPNGFLRTIIEGCPVGPTDWEQLNFDAETPPNTSVSVRVRAAATPAELATTTWIGPFESSPADLMLPPGPVPGLRFLEVEVTLVSDDERNTPRVRSVTVQRNCPI